MGKEITNSYIEVINELNGALNNKPDKTISVEGLFEAAMKKVVTIEKKKKDEKWKKLKNAVSDKNEKNEVHVRSHGRQGTGSEELKKVLKGIFGREFKIDPTNNLGPKKLIDECCGNNYQDYQISHIFEERTNNPLLFTAPWMLCLCPKLLDPFTGHETIGFPKLTGRFIEWAYNENKDYIKEYNALIIRL